MSKSYEVTGNLVDIQNKRTRGVRITIKNGIIQDIVEEENPETVYILPGFIDAHVHIESSMLVPAEFARLAVIHGTVATVSDPHEIANVVGIPGIEYMIENGKKVPFKFFFGAPSCVPATPFETAGARITVNDINYLLAKDEILYLSEMMNWPGVLNDDPEVMKKIAIARKFGKVVDGHAPGLRGKAAARYASAGISTDHECFTMEEAIDKLNCGMKIIIREGSAARNFDALVDLINDNEDRIMFCSDDKHPDNLVEGHINDLVKKAIARGIDVYKVLKAACINPVQHYGLPVGLLEPGDPADFIMVNDLQSFEVIRTYIDGEPVAENGETRISSQENTTINHFVSAFVSAKDFDILAKGSNINVIEPIEGQLITNRLQKPALIKNEKVVSDLKNDILKIAVVNRYEPAIPGLAFISRIGLKEGAIASSVAHDSHNIVVVGVDDESMAKATNLIIAAGGGVSAVNSKGDHLLPLPVAGLMSTEDGFKVAREYQEIDQIVKDMGSGLQSPFMTLSFMALLVIPACKLSDKGLFDGENFKFLNLFKEN